MKTYPSSDGAAAFVSLERGEDLLGGLNRAVEELGLRAAALQVIGALDEARVGYYDSDAKEYLPLAAGHVEIASGLGNVSTRDGKPFIHLHLVLTGRDGAAIGGHALEGCKAFVVEAHLTSLAGPPPVRQQAPDLGLAVWPGR